MLRQSSLIVSLLTLILPFVQSACVPNTTDTTSLQQQLQAGGNGFILSLCPNQIYNLSAPLAFSDANQEISTEGYPTDSTRATLLVGGFNVTIAIAGASANLSGIKIRNIQINGNRGNDNIYVGGGGNIEIGGSNQNQLVEYVKSYDPRGWTCLHLAEGSLACQNATIQNNDIGPCGHDDFQEWADGISLSCADSLVQNNVITDPTDGGIVIFQSPGSHIRNNTIEVKTRTSLGGINLVDVVPWKPDGNYSGVVVENNNIHGGYATEYGTPEFGKNNASAIIKVGIAIGQRVWWSDGRYGTNQSEGATVRNNILSGAFAFGIGISSAKDFVVTGNSFAGNVSFIGSYSANCTQSTNTPNPPVPVLLEPSSVTNLTFSMATYQPSNGKNPTSNVNSSDFTPINGTALGLICFSPPGSDQNDWPYGDAQVNAAIGVSVSDGGDGTPTSSSSGGGSATSQASPSGTTSNSAGDRTFGWGGQWRWVATVTLPLVVGLISGGVLVL